MADFGFRTPLLDFFRRGDVAHDVRLLAAQGALAPRAHEQVGLLMLLVADRDPEIAAAAERTLAMIPPAALSAFLARSDVTDDMREFFAARGIEPADIPAAQADAALVDTAAEEPAKPPAGEDEQTTLQRISGLNVAGRVKLAMKGTREERAILIRDPNRLVAVAVLSSPKLTETEVESIARMTTLSEETLRMIAMNRAWMKNYGIMLALAKNPKTPVAVSMNFLARISARDLRQLSTSRNIPDVLRIAARQRVATD